MTTPSEDPFVLMTLPAPSITEEAALSFLEERFGLVGEVAPLVSERDQNFRLQTTGGERYVLKIANSGESVAVLDFQARALEHLNLQSPEVPVPRLIAARDGRALQKIQTAQGTCLTRVVTYLEGMPIGDAPASVGLHRELGKVLADLGRALRGFFHPAARYPLLWDVQHASAVQSLIKHVDGASQRVLAETVFASHIEHVQPRLSALRAQVIHNDCNPDNVLVSADDPEKICGIIDFGDMVHAPLINDLAVAAAYQVVDSDDPVAACCDLVGAYHAVCPLEPEELDVLFALIRLRLAMSVCICAWRAKEHPENVAYLLGHHERYWETLEALASLDPGSVTKALSHAVSPTEVDTRGSWNTDRVAALRERRRRFLGPSLRLSYDEPLHITRGEGVWLYDSGGRAYLDAYNNVACVGHSHPQVVDATATQARRLNTNTRYLHEHIVTYAERLTARLPGDLSVCFFVCSGSEANDLAWQLARAATRNDGAIVTAFAYHGNTTAVQQLSPEELAGEQQEDWVATVLPPDSYRGTARDQDQNPGEAHAAQLDLAIESLLERGRKPAAFFVDTMYTSDGIHVAPPGYLASAWHRVRASGGLCIADEVQAGFGRTGDYFWGFEQQEVVPDIVTLGKPMGNGHPIAAVITTPAIAEEFARDRNYFNTFGGNPVACAAGLAVLDVIENERLQDNARVVGTHLRQRLAELATRHALIGDIRGAGLFYGIELVLDRNSRQPARDAAKEIVNGMRQAGVLIGRTGPHANVLKIRPPLVFSGENAEALVLALDAQLELAAARSP